jgi:hypothetical protein
MEDNLCQVRVHRYCEELSCPPKPPSGEGGCDDRVRRSSTIEGGSNPFFLNELAKPRDGLLRGACHRARVRATRWLAMTIVLLFENRIRSDRFFHSSCPGLTRASIIFAKACFEEDGLPGQARQ